MSELLTRADRSRGVHVAVLHPLKLAVYALSLASPTEPVQFNLLYECPFKHSAANFVTGRFGKSGERCQWSANAAQFVP